MDLLKIRKSAEHAEKIAVFKTSFALGRRLCIQAIRRGCSWQKGNAGI